MIKEYTPMKMTKAMRLLAVAAALCLGLLGCSPKAMEAFAAWQPEILLHPGETWEGKIPGDGKSPSYTVTVNTVPGLEARVEEDRLVLTATRAGEGQLTLAASAKGYHDTTLTLPVRVEPLPMELSWELVEEELAEGEEPAVWADQDRIGATVGETFTLAFSAAQVSNAVFDLHLPAELGAAQVDGDLATITVGEEYGEGFLTVTARAKDYDDKELSIPFSVVRGRLPLTLTAQGAGISSLELDRDSTVTLTAVTGEGAEIEASLEKKGTSAGGIGAKVETEGNTITIAATALGEGDLTVTAKGEGWLDNSVTIPVKVVKPTAAVIPSADSVTMEPGDFAKVTFTTRPEDAQVTASIEGEGFTTEISGNTLTILAAEATEGSAKVTLSVKAEGWLDGSATVKAAVKLEPVKLTASSGTLTLDEGESETVAITTTPEGAKITATPSDGITAQYSDGELTITADRSGTVKVTGSMENRDSASLTIQVVVTPEDLPEVDTSAYAEDAAEIIRLTNRYREQNGVGTLDHVAVVDVPAAIRAKEAADTWSHTRPDGSSFNTVFAQCGLKYAAYGENLFAVNQRYTPEQVVQAWKDSPTHNENLLRKEFDGIGIGICKVDGEYYYCQLFITE